MKKILIIEDDPDCGKSIQLCLEKYGYEVVLAKDGFGGLAKVKKENPDLIILDLILPAIDGFEVSRIIKGDFEAKNIPILVLSSVKNKLDFKFKKGVAYDDWLPIDDFYQKPFKFKELLERIHKLVNND